jgi:hypothetical protein
MACAVVPLALSVLLLAGAAPGQGADPSSSPGTARSPAAPGSPAAAGSPVASPSATPDPQVPHDAPDLEAVLPSEVDGTPLFTTSLGAPTWERFPAAATEVLVQLASALGVELSAIEFAFANDPTADPLYNYFAARAAGVPGSAVVDAYATLANDAEEGSTLADSELGGIPVRHLSAPNNPVGDVWFFASGDVLIGIQAADAATAERLIALLPTSQGSPAPSPVASAAGGVRSG